MGLSSGPGIVSVVQSLPPSGEQAERVKSLQGIVVDPGNSTVKGLAVQSLVL